MCRWERWALGALLAFVVAALAGYGTYGRHPEWLATQPSWAAGVYGAAFGVFAQGQVWLAGGVLVAVLMERAGGRWIPAFLALYGVSLASELAGTTWGVPFGAYRYGAALGVQWLDRVPVVIPLSWFCMAVASFGVARLVTGESRRWWRVVVGSLVLLGWDLSLDPAMSWVTKYWFWGESGPYYGMPWLNLVGWYVTGLALMTVLVWLRAERWIDGIPVTWLSWYWLANLLMPLGMNALAGLGGAVLATLSALGVFVAAVGLWGRRHAAGPTPVAVAVRGGGA